MSFVSAAAADDDGAAPSVTTAPLGVHSDDKVPQYPRNVAMHTDGRACDREKHFFSETDAAKKAVELQKYLLEQVGDDVTSGTVQMPLETEAPSSSSEPDARGFTIHVRGTDYRVPLTDSAAAELYYMMDESAVGVEGEGTRIDATRRSAREVKITKDECVLPPALERFVFEGALQHIRQALAPTAVDLAVRPDKLVMYGPGDFFGRHVDTPAGPFHFGTVTLNIPTAASFNRCLLQGAGDGGTNAPGLFENEGWTAEEVCENLGRTLATVPVPDGAEGETRTVVHFGYDRFGGGGDGVAADEAPPPVRGSDPATDAAGNGGALHFYMAREVSTQFRVSTWRRPEAPTNADFYGQLAKTYDTPTAAEALEKAADLTAYSPADLRASRKSLPLNYGAWLTDVVHEVVPVLAGFRVAVTYKLFKRGHRVPRTPLWGPIEKQLTGVFLLLRQLETLDQRGKGSSPAPPELVPDSVGFLLRHTYSPAALKPNELKGLDAVVYAVAAAARRCYLLSAVFIRRGDGTATSWRVLQQPVGRQVLATADPHNEVVGMAGPDIGPALGKFPRVNKCVWVQLGHGRLVGGGASYGNADCEAPWWYREAVLVVRPEPSHWRRRKVVFAIEAFGAPHWRELMKNWAVQQTIAEFL